jgi:F-type H+-transporting ATPase subunit epsilon
MQKIKVRIITPTGIQQEFEAETVVMPGSEGEFGVMDGHAPMIVQLKAGEIRLEILNELPKIFRIKHQAVVKIGSEGVDILSPEDCPPDF